MMAQCSGNEIGILSSQHILYSEFFLFSEKHGETDDRSINQQTTDDGHNHGRYLDRTAVRENGWKSCDDIYISPIPQTIDELYMLEEKRSTP